MASRKKSTGEDQELVTTREVIEDGGLVEEAVENHAPVTYEDDTSPVEEVSPLIAVSVVMIVGDRCVVEWRTPAGSLRRAWADAVIEAATEQALNALQPYGDDLGTVVQDVHWSQAQAVEELHRMGVWRLQDLTANVLNDMYRGLARVAMRDAEKRKANA